MSGYRNLFALVTIMIVSACQTVEPVVMQAAQKFENSYESQGRNFALPPGQWVLVSSRQENSGVSHAAEQNFSLLASVTNNVIDRVVITWVQRKYNARWKNHWTRYPSCLTDDAPQVLYSVVRENTGPEHDWVTGTAIDCWHLRSFSLGRTGSELDLMEDLHNFAAANSLYLPVAMLGARFAQKPLSDRRDYIEYLWNPDMLLAKPDGSPWLPADWYQDAVTADPARKAVVEGLKQWGIRWRETYPTSTYSN